MKIFRIESCFAELVILGAYMFRMTISESKYIYGQKILGDTL